MTDEAGKLRDAMFATRNLLGEMAKIAPDIAHSRKTIYDAYVSEGFTPEQALKLVGMPLFGGVA